jgi:hypothetical protein
LIKRRGGTPTRPLGELRTAAKERRRGEGPPEAQDTGRTGQLTYKKQEFKTEILLTAGPFGPFSYNMDASEGQTDVFAKNGPVGRVLRKIGRV